MTTLIELKKEAHGRVKSIELSEKTSSRLRSMGVREGEEIIRVGAAPFGDPIIYKVGKTTIALRKSDAAGVEIEV